MLTAEILKNLNISAKSKKNSNIPVLQPVCQGFRWVKFMKKWIINFVTHFFKLLPYYSYLLIGEVLLVGGDIKYGEEAHPRLLKLGSASPAKDIQSPDELLQHVLLLEERGGEGRVGKGMGADGRKEGGWRRRREEGGRGLGGRREEE